MMRERLMELAAVARALAVSDGRRIGYDGYGNGARPFDARVHGMVGMYVAMGLLTAERAVEILGA